MNTLRALALALLFALLACLLPVCESIQVDLDLNDRQRPFFNTRYWVEQAKKIQDKLPVDYEFRSLQELRQASRLLRCTKWLRPISSLPPPNAKFQADYLRKQAEDSGTKDLQGLFDATLEARRKMVLDGVENVDDANPPIMDTERGELWDADIRGDIHGFLVNLLREADCFGLKVVIPADVRNEFSGVCEYDDGGKCTPKDPPAPADGAGEAETARCPEDKRFNPDAPTNIGGRGPRTGCDDRANIYGSRLALMLNRENRAKFGYPGRILREGNPQVFLLDAAAEGNGHLIAQSKLCATFGAIKSKKFSWLSAAEDDPHFSCSAKFHIAPVVVLSRTSYSRQNRDRQKELWLFDPTYAALIRSMRDGDRMGLPFNEGGEGVRDAFVRLETWLAYLRIGTPNSARIARVVIRQATSGSQNSPNAIMLRYTDDLFDDILPAMFAPHLRCDKDLNLPAHLENELLPTPMASKPASGSSARPDNAIELEDRRRRRESVGVCSDCCIIS